MTRRHILQALVAVAALVALVLAWPTIAGTARNPRVGDWVPSEDPGTRLTLIQGGRRYVIGVGEVNWSCDIECFDAVGYREVDARLYAEVDGVLGWQDEPIENRTSTTTPVPSATGGLAGGSGYRPNGHLLVEIEFDDGQTAKATVAPPMNLRRGAETEWRALAVAWDLGVLIEWRQTKEHLLIRRSALPGAAEPTWTGGGFRVDGMACQFTDDTQIARLFRARVPSQPEGDQNVHVIILSDEDGVRTEVVVR